MMEHPTALLQAYHDGELHGRRLRQVEAHVARCEACQAELESLDDLSALLTAYSAAPALTQPDRFVAQVGLRLERRAPASAPQTWARRGWYLLPVVLMVAWIAARAAFFVTDVILTALELEPAASGLAARVAQAAHGGPIKNLVGLGVLGNPAVLGALVTVFIGVLYWSWLASWWISQREQPSPEHGNGQG